MLWCGRHGGRGSRGGQGNTLAAATASAIAVELGIGRDVAANIHGAPHDDELLDAQEGLRIFGGSQRNVS